MRRSAAWLSVALASLAASGGGWGDDAKPTGKLAGLKKSLGAIEAAGTEAGDRLAPDADHAPIARLYKERASVLGRLAVALADAAPDDPEAVEILAWVHLGGLGGHRITPEAVDLAYDRLADRYLDRDALLPVCRLAWSDGVATPHAEAFLRAAAERSPNRKVRGLSTFNLARLLDESAGFARDLGDPTRGPILSANLKTGLGDDALRRLRGLDAPALEREAEALYEKTIREFPDDRPMGDAFPPLGEQAEGGLFSLRHVRVGRPAPDIDGEDVDGRPIKLSDYRGKVVVLTFWASWCGPCMGLVPAEKTLAERMKGRPFVMLGVNGDEDRDKAKSVSAKEGITWRSFWNGGPRGTISTRWSIRGWPTVYTIDADGTLRDDGLVYFQHIQGANPERAVEALVAEAEKAGK